MFLPKYTYTHIAPLLKKNDKKLSLEKETIFQFYKKLFINEIVSTKRTRIF